MNNLGKTQIAKDGLEVLFFKQMSAFLLTQKDPKLFLACSGGLDSVVLAHLMNRYAIPFVLLHCNFQLRGEESMRDEAFVRALSIEMGIELKVRLFDTLQEQKNRNTGTQETARNLRYEWFQVVMDKADPSRKQSFLMTAHHADDQVETIAMNFFRGTGISGLTGMSYLEGQIFRPLLACSKEELMVYATENGLTWVEDSSNSASDYTRNFFRNEILPLVKSVYPSYANNLFATALRLREVETIYQFRMKQLLKKLLVPQGSSFAVAINKLKAASPLDTIMHELFTPFGFTPHQVNEIKKLFTAQTGKFICSESFRVLKNRNWLLIDPVSTIEKQIVVIEEPVKEIFFQQGRLQFLNENPPEQYPVIPDQVWVDANKIEYPLIIRPCKRGDYLYPLGMSKKKKIARFLTDLKLSLTDKENQWVIESNKRIVWIIGRRLDDRFKLTSGSKPLKIVYLKSQKG